MDAHPSAQLTHLGLYVDDMDAMVDFYTGLIGMVVTDRGEFLGRHLSFLSRNADEHHQLVLVEGRSVPEGTQLLSQLSFRLDDDDLGALRWYHQRALELGAKGMEGRNHGNSWSIYFLDPEGNRIEIYTPTPWYVSQPWRIALDLDRSDAEIRAETTAQIEATATWSAVEPWKTGLAQRLLETAPAAAEEPYRSIWTSLKDVAFTQGWIDIDGVSTRYVEAGDPAHPSVLMLHGTGGHWETFAPNLGPLSEHFHCLAIDMVGNGFSDKPDYDYEIAVYAKHALGVLEHFGIEQTALIGMSLGAWVAARLAIDEPDRVTDLILMSPAGLVATAENMARIRAERTAAVENPTWPSIKAMFNHLIADEKNRLPDVIALRQAIYRLPETREVIDHVLILQDPAARERNLIPADDWRRITAPTLVVASGKDHGEYQSTARRVAEYIPDAEVLEMPHVKHWPHFEDPEAFNSAALRFLGH